MSKHNNTKCILYFAYKRHAIVKLALRELIELSEDREIIIICDAARDDSESDEVEVTRRVINELCASRRNTTILYRSYNYGLALNIIEALKTYSQCYEIINVVEEDILITKEYLQFIDSVFEMDSTEIASGWNFGYRVDSDLEKSSFISVWGWAARTSMIKRFIAQYDRNKYELFDLSIEQYWKLNIRNATSRYSKQVLLNLFGFKKTWAIYLYCYAIREGIECVYGRSNTVINLGFYHGENYTTGDRYSYIDYDKKSLYEYVNATSTIVQKMFNVIIYPVIKIGLKIKSS